MMAPAVRTLAVEYDSNTPEFQPGTNIYPVNIQQICYVNVSVTTIQNMSYVSPAARLFVSNTMCLSLVTFTVRGYWPHQALLTCVLCILAHCQVHISPVTALLMWP